MVSEIVQIPILMDQKYLTGLCPDWQLGYGEGGSDRGHPEVHGIYGMMFEWVTGTAKPEIAIALSTLLQAKRAADQESRGG